MIRDIPTLCSFKQYFYFVIVASSNSDGDDASVFSEINTWAFGNHTSNKLCVKPTKSLNSTCTDISFAESIDDVT